jgi:hypothetical protein
LLAWAEDNGLNDFHIWLQQDIINVLGRDATDTWENLTSLAATYLGHADHVVRPSLEVVQPQAQPPQRCRRNAGQGESHRQRACVEVDEGALGNGQEEAGQGATEAAHVEGQDGVPAVPAGEEEEPAIVTWRDYMSFSYWVPRRN